MFDRIPNMQRRMAGACLGGLIVALTTNFAGLANTASAAEATTAAEDATSGLFGTREIRNTNLKAFTKWTGMLSRSGTEQAGKAAQIAAPNTDEFKTAVAGACEAAPGFPCGDAALDALIHDLQQKTPAQQMDQVNRFMNRVRYVTDDVNWGVADYWATPQEFLRRDGDCEDFAIAKYILLKQLGFSADDMRIVVLEDQNLKTHHAVLMVKSANTRLILDNQISDVVPATSIHHYKPVYSINEEAWWLHIPVESASLLAEQNNKD